MIKVVMSSVKYDWTNNKVAASTYKNSNIHIIRCGSKEFIKNITNTSLQMCVYV